MSFSFPSLTGAKVRIHGHNIVDSDQNPTGGHASQGTVFDYSQGKFSPLMIRWHDGPLDREAGEIPNGAMVEDVLEVCRIRLEFYQKSKFSCPENAEAIRAIEQALKALENRRLDRRERGVEGKHEV